VVQHGAPKTLQEPEPAASQPLRATSEADTGLATAHLDQLPQTARKSQLCWAVRASLHTLYTQKVFLKPRYPNQSVRSTWLLLTASATTSSDQRAGPKGRTVFASSPHVARFAFLFPVCPISKYPTFTLSENKHGVSDNARNRQLCSARRGEEATAQLIKTELRTSVRNS